jgi:hypothetical protein
MMTSGLGKARLDQKVLTNSVKAESMVIFIIIVNSLYINIRLKLHQKIRSEMPPELKLPRV